MFEPHPALSRRPASLCQLAGVWRGAVEPWGTWAEPKIDGVRACWIDGALVAGREGTPLHGVERIARRLRSLESAFDRPMFFDAEYQVAGSLRETLRHIGRRAAAPDEGVLWIFDGVPMDRWRADDDPRPLVERKAALADAFDAVARRDRAATLSWEWPEGSRGRPADTACVRLMPDEWLEDAGAVDRRAREIWAAGGEGLMLKDAEAPYRRLRSSAWRKVKQAGWSTQRAA